MADEQKKLFPDCWKRKRTVSQQPTTPTAKDAPAQPAVPMPAAVPQSPVTAAPLPTLAPVPAASVIPHPSPQHQHLLAANLAAAAAAVNAHHAATAT